MKLFKRLLCEEDGPTAVEYAVMLAMIIMACIGAVVLVGQGTYDSFDDSSGKLQGVFNP